MGNKFGGDVILRIAICEDDRKQQQLLENYITNLKLEESYELEKFDSGEDLVRVYENGQKFSIILLDMQLAELDGIQTAEIIRKYDKDSIIIIITSIIEYAVDGYSVNAYDFILKPVEENRFVKVFRSAIKKIQTENNKTYVLQTRGMTIVLKLSNIVYIESARKKINVHCEKEQYFSNEKISIVEKKLSKFVFVRISRYYLVNMAHIKKIGTNDILLSTGEVLNYSKSHQKEIKIRYMNFMMGDR
ncbi:MAG: LytTR family DNA-binding domain-containing protein [Bacillota bacterium]|nr:LytTR family DNA-binding domain-containing protein [Bacillota bacterium]